MTIAFFFLGIEELAVQLEEPFSVLPLDKIAGGIGMAAEDHVNWAKDADEAPVSATNGTVVYG